MRNRLRHLGIVVACAALAGCATHESVAHRDALKTAAKADYDRAIGTYMTCIQESADRYAPKQQLIATDIAEASMAECAGLQIAVRHTSRQLSQAYVGPGYQESAVQIEQSVQRNMAHLNDAARKLAIGRVVKVRAAM